MRIMSSQLNSLKYAYSKQSGGCLNIVVFAYVTCIGRNAAFNSDFAGLSLVYIIFIFCIKKKNLTRLWTTVTSVLKFASPYFSFYRRSCLLVFQDIIIFIDLGVCVYLPCTRPAYAMSASNFWSNFIFLWKAILYLLNVPRTT